MLTAFVLRECFVGLCVKFVVARSRRPVIWRSTCEDTRESGHTRAKSAANDSPSPTTSRNTCTATRVCAYVSWQKQGNCVRVTCVTPSLNLLRTSLRIPHPNHSSPSQRPSFEHAGLTCYTLLSPSITFSPVSLLAQNLPFPALWSTFGCTIKLYSLIDWVWEWSLMLILS